MIGLPTRAAVSDREFDELVENVRVNRLREPLVVRGNQLIDRRNRVQACPGRPRH